MTTIIFDATTYRNANLTFAAGLMAKPSPAAFIPAAVDSAWLLGYDLGREGVMSAVASSRCTATERTAFNAGYAAGLDAYHADERDRLEATIAQWEADHAYDPEAHELAEARMVA
jgi:hypothetical protein